MITLVILVSCGKDRNVSYYPDCFKELTSSPYKSGVGCGNILVTAELDKNRLVSILLNEKALDLKTKCKSFLIENDTNNIKINYYSYSNDPDSIYFDFCSDLVFLNGNGSKTTWQAVSGKITVVVSAERSNRKDCEGYKTSIELDNIKFTKENSMQDTTIASLIIRDRTVGICIP